MARLGKVKVSYSVVPVARGGCVDRSVEQAVSAGRAAHSWPMVEMDSEGNENGNESVRAIVGNGGEGAVAGVG